MFVLPSVVSYPEIAFFDDFGRTLLCRSNGKSQLDAKGL